MQNRTSFEKYSSRWIFLKRHLAQVVFFFFFLLEMLTLQLETVNPSLPYNLSGLKGL